jgi:predicted N-acyltransferase
VRARVLDSYTAVDAAAWDRLVGDGSPFLEHQFLSLLELTGCASPATGWTPRPVVVESDSGALLAAAPGWVKTHSMGEFVYDHAWAHAAHSAGIQYYPKLIVGVPFAPVTGPRLLGDRSPAVREALWRGLRDAAAGTHGLHVLFNEAAEANELAARGAFTRVQFQYWWKNDGYRTYDDYLSRFSSDRRNKLRRERRLEPGLSVEDGLHPDRATIDALYDFYSDTTDKYFYGNRYLSLEFFRALADRWGHRLHAVIARDRGAPIAGALNVQKGRRLYGRYWGALAQVKYLHFEVCYHRGIEHAIRQQLDVFEPGHGGEHKYIRGFLPEITWSSHQLADGRLHHALADFSRREAIAVRAEVAALHATSPFVRPFAPPPADGPPDARHDT